MKMQYQSSSWARACALAAALAALAGCSGNGTSGTDTVTVNGDVPLAYVKRSTAVRLDPVTGADSAPGGDLMLREKSSASAAEYNLTARFTQGVGDASDPEVSYDGKRIVFAMVCPTSNTATVDAPGGPVPACTGHWNIWEYTLTETSGPGLANGSFRRVTSSTSHDDVDPVYLPANRGIIFSSNRQTKSSLNQALGRAYFATDEYERQRVFNLHSMGMDGSNIQQITFNQSHDRNPVIRPNGDIMFSRWEHVGDRNRFAIFRSKPDGTDLMVLYGAHSQGNSYLHPRDMDPKGAYPGQVMSSLMPLSRTHEGGALHMIDVKRYSEDNTPSDSTVPAQGGQREITAQPLNAERGLSLYGRATTPYPLWDGTDRVLVAWRPCEVTRDGAVVSCTTLTADEIARLADGTRTKDVAQSDSLQDNAPAAYAIYMFDPAKQTWLIVAAPPEGFMYTDPVALAPRTEPNVVEPTTVDAALAAQNLALIEVRSVYDTDGLGRMAEQMLTDSDRAGCTQSIALTQPAAAASDPRAQVADILRIKNPADPAYGCAPARFVRAVRAVAPPSGATGVRNALGETNFEGQQILGYAPVEPDGSFKLKVPADVPLALSVIDSEGRAIQTHTNWIQVRPGERRTCDGCHSPRRGGALNSGSIADTLAAALNKALSDKHDPGSGETLASLRTREDPSALNLSPDPVSTDIWADTTQPGVSAKPSIALIYTGNAAIADDLATPAPTNGVINYLYQIQPLWTRDRGAATCTNCHNDPDKLDLRDTVSGSGRVSSYAELVLGDPLINPATGRPVIEMRDGVPMVVRGPALVETSSGAANSAGQARKSRLTEILWGQTLLAGADARAKHPDPPASAPDHSKLLNKAERRLVAEWMDLGGQYYNDPFDAGSGVRVVSKLSLETFTTTILPILRSTCAGCHQAGLFDSSNRYVLTGSPDGDFNVTLGMINDTCNAASNPLLARPSTVPHPAGAAFTTPPQAVAVLPVGGTAYTAISNWITQGCPNP
jgi:hypothetical protein